MISRRLAVKYDGFLLLSMGDLLRKEVEANKNDQLWQRLGKKLNAGEPVPMVSFKKVLKTGLNFTCFLKNKTEKKVMGELFNINF